MSGVTEGPEQPYGPGAICDRCGHFASRHDQDGCRGVTRGCAYGCADKPFLWRGAEWPRPWLPTPEGLVSA